MKDTLPGRDQKTQRVVPALWERCSKTGSVTMTEARARPVGAKAPAARRRALAVGFGPTARCGNGIA